MISYGKVSLEIEQCDRCFLDEYHDLHCRIFLRASHDNNAYNLQGEEYLSM